MGMLEVRLSIFMYYLATRISASCKFHQLKTTENCLRITSRQTCFTSVSFDSSLFLFCNGHQIWNLFCEVLTEAFHLITLLAYIERTNILHTLSLLWDLKKSAHNRWQLTELFFNLQKQNRVITKAVCVLSKIANSKP